MSFFGGVDWPTILLKIVLAIVILAVTWLLAWAVRWVVKKVVGRLRVLQRQGADGTQIGDSIGQIAALLVWLFGLIAVLQVFALEQVLAPLQGLLNGILAVLPNLIGAVFIFFIGFVFAKIARQLVETALGAVNLSKLSKTVSSVGPKHGQTGETPTGEDGAATAPSAAASDSGSAVNWPQLAGNLVFAIIIIVVSIAALQVLGVAAISVPAQQMLTLFLKAIPSIVAAGILLAIGFAISTFVGRLLEQLLKGLGTDRALASTGVLPDGTSASTILTRIAQVAIMIFFAIMAARLLGFPEITAILNQILALGGRVLFGAVIIAAGFLIANLIGRFAGTGLASRVLRYVAIALFAAMGLKFMGLADSIINLAFGAVVVGAALAAALAYGLGGREAAARSLGRIGEQVAAATEAEEKAPAAEKPERD